MAEDINLIILFISFGLYYENIHKWDSCFASGMMEPKYKNC